MGGTLKGLHQASISLQQESTTSQDSYAHTDPIKLLCHTDPIKF